MNAKGGGEEAIGQHGIKGSKEGGADQGESGAVEFVGQAVQTRRLIGGGLFNSSGQLREGEGDLERVLLQLGQAGEAVEEGGEVGTKEAPESTGSAAAAVAA